jgi:hypothetical protein
MNNNNKKLNDLLKLSKIEKFKDPTKQKKQVIKKEIKKEKERKENFYRNKITSEEKFNNIPNEEEYKTWKKYVIHSVEREKIEDKLNNIKYKDLNYISCSNNSNTFTNENNVNLFAIVDFLNAVSHCSLWIENQLKEIGWNRNMTGYNPIAVSHSTNELLFSTIECVKMACKQMLRLYDYESKI